MNDRVTLVAVVCLTGLIVLCIVAAVILQLAGHEIPHGLNNLCAACFGAITGLLAGRGRNNGKGNGNEPPGGRAALP